MYRPTSSINHSQGFLSHSYRYMACMFLLLNFFYFAVLLAIIVDYVHIALYYIYIIYFILEIRFIVFYEFILHPMHVSIQTRYRSNSAMK